MLRNLFKIAIVFVVCLIVLRYVVETRYVKNKIVYELNQYLKDDMNLNLKMNSFELSFFPPALHAYNVQVFPNENNPGALLKANRISVLPSMWKALLLKFGLQEIQLVSPFLNINKIQKHFDSLNINEDKNKNDVSVWPISLSSPVNLIRIFQAQLYYGSGEMEYTASNVNTVLDFSGNDELTIYGSVSGTSLIKSNKILMNDLGLSLDVRIDRAGLKFKYLKMNSSKFTLTAKGRVLPILGKTISGKKLKNIEDVLDKVDSIFVDEKKREFLGVKGNLELDLVNSDLSFVNYFIASPVLQGEIIGSGKVNLNHLFDADFSKSLTGEFDLRSNNAMIDSYALMKSKFDGVISSGKVKFNRILVKNDQYELAQATGEIGLSSDVPLDFSIMPKKLSLKEVMGVLNADFNFIDFTLESDKLTLKGKGSPFKLNLGGIGTIHSLRFADIPQVRILSAKEFSCPLNVDLDIASTGLDFKKLQGNCSHGLGAKSDLKLFGNVYFTKKESLNLDIVAKNFGADFFETFIPKKARGVADWELQLRKPDGQLKSPMKIKTTNLAIGGFKTNNIVVDGDVYGDRIHLKQTSMLVSGPDKKQGSVQGSATFKFNSEKSVEFLLKKSSLPKSSVKQLLLTFFNVPNLDFSVSRFEGSLKGPLMQPFLWTPNAKIAVRDVVYNERKIVDAVQARLTSPSSQQISFNNIKIKNLDWAVDGKLRYLRSSSSRAVRNVLGYTSLDKLKGAFTGGGSALNLQSIPYVGSMIPSALKVKSNIKHNFYISGLAVNPKVSGDSTFKNIMFQTKKIPDISNQLRVDKNKLAVSFSSNDKTLDGSYDLLFASGKFSTKVHLKNYLLNFLFSKKIKFDPRNYSYVSADLNYQGDTTDFFGGDGALDLRNFVMNMRQDFFEGDSKIFYRLVKSSKIKIVNGKMIVPPAGVNFRGNFGELSVWNTPTQSRDLDLKFKGNIMFKILPAVLPNIELASGGANYSGRFYRKDGVFNYDVDVKNSVNPKPAFSLKGLRPTFKDLKFNVRVDQNRFHIKDFYAQKGSGYLTASGNVYQPGVNQRSLVNLKLFNTKFDVDSKLFKIINTEVSGDLTLSGKGKPYDLQGDIILDGIKASKDFSIKKEILNLIRQQDIQSISVSEAPLLNFSVNIKGSRSIVVKNRNMDFLMSTDLRLTGNSSKPGIVGLANIDRGKFLFRREFRVEKGIVSFDQGSRIDPYIDVIAVSDIASRRITMNITGRSSNAKVDLSAEPAVDDKGDLLKKWDILVLLTTGKLPKNSSGSLASQTLSILASPLENELEKLFSYSGQNIISQIYLDFEVSETTGNLVPKLIVPVNVTEAVSLNVEVDSESVWEVSSDYSVNENIFVSGSVVGKSDDTEEAGSSNLINGVEIDDTAFDLKFRFNFQ